MAAPVTIDLAALAAAAAAALDDRIGAARLVCFPTDTVYGVGGALTPAVAGALVAAKGRAPGKPLQVVFATLDALEAGVVMAPELRSACRRLLPGPVTLLLPYPAGWDFPPPGAHVLAGLRRPLVASSANRSGASAAASLDEVDAALLARCDLALDAGLVSGLASSVIDLSRYAATGRWRLLRTGTWGVAEVAARLAGTRERPPPGGHRR